MPPLLPPHRHSHPANRSAQLLPTGLLLHETQLAAGPSRRWLYRLVTQLAAGPSQRWLYRLVTQYINTLYQAYKARHQ